MSNMEAIIKAHNHRLSTPQQATARTCNCPRTKPCPLNGQCLTKNIIYTATVTDKDNENNEKVYIGMCETAFKDRFYNHNMSLKNRRYESKTELSKYIWSLKDNNTNYEIKWSIYKKTPGYSNISKRCGLCTAEKVAIITFPNKNKLLNKRTELISKCRHETSSC